MIGRITLVTSILISLVAGAEVIDLRAEMPAVRFQGYRNTCSAFAATSLMEFLIHAKSGTFVDLSESYNYWAGKEYALENETLRAMYRPLDGMTGYHAVYAYKFGSMLEEDWPYEVYNWYQLHDARCRVIDGKPSSECFTGVPPAEAPVQPYRIEPILIQRENIGQWLLVNKKPVVFNVTWCPSAVDNATGKMRIPTNSELEKCGGHVVTLVGFDSEKREFIYRNSWGDSWGDKGHGTLPEEIVLKYCEACPYLPNLEQFSLEFQRFLINVSMGVSGTLVNQQ